MTAALVTSFGLACLLGGAIVVLLFLAYWLTRRLDRAQERIDDLITEVAEANAAVAYWKQECIGAAVEDPVAQAVEAAARGIDLAGIDENNLSVLKANHEPLTDEEREQLDEQFGAITRGEIPYVQGIEEDQQ